MAEILSVWTRYVLSLCFSSERKIGFLSQYSHRNGTYSSEGTLLLAVTFACRELMTTINDAKLRTLFVVGRVQSASTMSHQQHWDSSQHPCYVRCDNLGIQPMQWHQNRCCNDSWHCSIVTGTHPRTPWGRWKRRSTCHTDNCNSWERLWVTMKIVAHLSCSHYASCFGCCKHGCRRGNSSQLDGFTSATCQMFTRTCPMVARNTVGMTELTVAMTKLTCAMLRNDQVRDLQHVKSSFQRCHSDVQISLEKRKWHIERYKLPLWHAKCVLHHVPSNREGMEMVIHVTYFDVTSTDYDCLRSVRMLFLLNLRHNPTSNEWHLTKILAVSVCHTHKDSSTFHHQSRWIDNSQQPGATDWMTNSTVWHVRVISFHTFTMVFDMSG